MISFKQAKVLDVVSCREGISKVRARMDSDIVQAINYDGMTGDIRPGDTVVLNTTAVEMGLGTGGSHFILWNFRHKSLKSMGPGHIMKLRYTPMQFCSLSVEEEESPFQALVEQCTSLEGMPVVVGTLHSQLPAVAAAIKRLNPELHLAYVMTDGAALPIAFSEMVAQLKKIQLIDTTITCGHAFGGDLEAVNIFSALAAAKTAAKADVCVVVMGPGIVGTGTTLGYSGIEQGVILNAVSSLQGTPIAVMRLHFADKRKRHFGVSHHTLTSLSIASLARSHVILPDLVDEKRKIVFEQLAKAEIPAKHDVVEIADNITLKALRELDLKVSTMGRNTDQEPDFFRAAGAAGIYAVTHVKRQKE